MCSSACIDWVSLALLNPWRVIILLARNDQWRINAVCIETELKVGEIYVKLMLCPLSDSPVTHMLHSHVPKAVAHDIRTSYELTIDAQTYLVNQSRYRPGVAQRVPGS